MYGATIEQLNLNMGH